MSDSSLRPQDDSRTVVLNVLSEAERKNRDELREKLARVSIKDRAVERRAAAAADVSRHLILLADPVRCEMSGGGKRECWAFISTNSERLKNPSNEVIGSGTRARPPPKGNTKQSALGMTSNKAYIRK
ncbi:unnamed protein product [Phytophthora lilii]|uniref:Unnamed protein product n=1 Tax=Phytophthora lilii TaxID=2077276 RepID=A0A9W7D9I7_9STRA|nr:unnamed protein product [Phytophthora lilii]